MSDAGETEQQTAYVVTDDDGKVKIQQEGYIQESTINDFTFTFGTPQEITESTADKNRGRPPVSFTKQGRSAYAPGSVNYPDEASSANMVVMKCIIQHTEALKAANHKYAKTFVNIGTPEYVIDKIIEDAKNENQMSLGVKDRTELMNGHYWLRCNLDKLTKANTHILLEEKGTSVTMDLDKMLIEFGKSIEATIVFTLSAVMNNNNMNEELDLEHGQYYITMKPTEVWAINESDVEGPKLTNTNARKNEGADVTGHLFASGKLAELAMKHLRVSGRK